jgi:hypothetical protein
MTFIRRWREGGSTGRLVGRVSNRSPTVSIYPLTYVRQFALLNERESQCPDR